MRKLKKLKISSMSTVSNEVFNKIHLDVVDNILAKEHYGYYILVKNKKKSTSRLYFSYEFYKNYFDKKKELNPNLTFLPPKKSNLLIFDNHKKYFKLIKSIILNVFMSEECTSTVIKEIYGLDIFLNALNKSDIMMTDETKISIKHQRMAYEYCYDNNLSKSSHANLRQFFGKLEKVYSYLIAIDSNEGRRKKGKEGLASSIVYKLDYYARKNLDTIISRVKEYNEWIEEFDCDNLFTIENLSYTYFSRIKKFGSQSSGFNRTINKISIKLYSIDLHCWNYIRNGRYFYNNKEQEKYHKNLIEISKKGIDIDITNEKIFAVWHKAIFPNFPLENDARDGLKEVFHDRSRFIEKVIKRLKIEEKINIDIIDIYSRIFPTIHEIYPLVLLLLAREGINTEILFNWSIKKNFKEKTVTLGNATSLALVVESLKSKTNTDLTCVIANDSIQKKYIDFYLKWMQKYYFHSKSNKFLQYIPESQYHKINDIKIYNFVHIYKQKKSFFKKYKITDLNGKRIDQIKHSRLRVYGNYADYMRGLSNFERQFKKGHKDIDTQQYYENNIEWKDQNNHKINKIQKSIVKVFRGEECNEKLSILFEGPLADCSDPKKPTFLGAKKLKENEACSSWSKCLTMCNKATIIPETHGPVIYAWILHMEEEKQQYIRESDWEKEYLYDYESAKNTFLGLTDEEKVYSKKNAFKYKTFVSRRFHKKFKSRNKYNHAG